MGNDVPSADPRCDASRAVHIVDDTDAEVIDSDHDNHDDDDDGGMLVDQLLSELADIAETAAAAEDLIQLDVLSELV